MLPSIKTIRRIFPATEPATPLGFDADTAAALIRSVLTVAEKRTNVISPHTALRNIAAALKMTNIPVCPTPVVDLALLIVNHIIGGYATVYIDTNNKPGAQYVNRGDTYDTTLLYDYRAGRYIVTSWGDWYERNEKR